MRLTSQADGFSFGAYHAQPEDARHGGLIVLQEIFGVTDGVRQICDSFAAQGFEVIAPQLFDRSQRDFEGERTPAGYALGLRYRKDTAAELTLGDIGACIAALEPPVFVIGFCYGGSMAWMAACRLPGLAGVSAFYGSGIADSADETPLPPTILHFGKTDKHIGPDHWSRIAEAHPDLPLYLYEGGHGFFSEDSEAYSPDAARLARLRTLQLFRRSAGAKGEV